MTTFDSKVVAQVTWWNATSLQKIGVKLRLTGFTLRQTGNTLQSVGLSVHRTSVTIILFVLQSPEMGVALTKQQVKFKLNSAEIIQN